MTSYFKKFRMKSLWRSISLTVPIGARAVIASFVGKCRRIFNGRSLGHLLQKYGKAVTCVCFMGGDAEPFEVERLAGFLHRQSIALVKVGWYSGKNELPEGLSVQNFEYIKLGPYIEKLGGLKSPDTNQHFYRIYGDEMKDITYRFWRI